MLLLDRSSVRDLLNFVPAMKKDLPFWGTLDVALTGRTPHNIMHMGRKLEEALPGREGAIYVHDRQRLLSFVRHPVPARDCAAAFAADVSGALPAGSCEVSSAELTSQGLGQLEARLIENNDNAAKTSQHSTLYLQRAARKERVIMIADDNVEMCELLGEALGRYGECVVLNDPAGIAEAYLEKVPDIVFLDINFPGTSGLEVIDVLRKYDKDAYIVMMTGASTASNAVSAKTRGAKSFIGKPFDLPRLDHEITRCPTMNIKRPS